MRILSVAERSEILSSPGTLPIHSLVEVHSPAIAEVQYLHTNGETGVGEDWPVRTATTSGPDPDIYKARAHLLALPDDRADGVSENELLVDNADGGLNAMVYGGGDLTRGQVVQYWAFRGVGRPFLGPMRYDMIGAELEDRTGALKLILSYDRTLADPFPSSSFTPALYPGLY